MGLMDKADELGKQIQAKREAQKTADAAAKKAGAEAAAKQRQHEENKRQGML